MDLENWSAVVGSAVPIHGAYQIVQRRFQNWVRSGVMEKILPALAEHLRQVGELDLKECFVDGTFVRAKKGRLVGKTKCGKGTKIMRIADGHGLSLALRTESASPNMESCSVKK